LGRRPGQTWSISSASDEADPVALRRSEAVTHCRRVKGRLDAFSAQLAGEPEATRIVDLWYRYCDRYGTWDEPELEVAELAQKGRPEKLVQLEKELFEPLDGRGREFAPQLGDF
jgi:hypothetical protein